MNTDRRKKFFIYLAITALVLGSISIGIYASRSQDKETVPIVENMSLQNGSPETDLEPIEGNDLTYIIGKEKTTKTLKLLSIKPDGTDVKELHTLDFEKVCKFSFSPKTMKACFKDKRSLYTLDLRTFKYKLLGAEISSARFNPDYNTVVFASLKRSFKYMK